MTQTVNSPQFNRNARKALDDAFLQKALARSEKGFIERRKAAVEKLPEYDALRDNARDLKDHILSHLDLYLEAYEKNVVASGGHVHWAATAEEANEIILGICKRLDAKTVTKGKSMISEEIDLNEVSRSQAASSRSRPTSANTSSSCATSAPSHIIAPAVHSPSDQVEADLPPRPHRSSILQPRPDRAALPLLVEEARTSCARSS
jgi:L-lactate dehydrogenase complex protein LldF